MKFLILYRVFIRKAYKTWHKSRSEQARVLSLSIICLYTISILLLLEGFLGIKGVLYASHYKTLPLVPVAILIIILFYILNSMFFNNDKKFDEDKISIIRKAYNKMENVKRRNVIFCLIISLLIFVFSFVVSVIKVNYQ